MLQGGVVIGQIVLSEEIEHQRGPHFRRKRGLRLVPRIGPETTALFPRHIVVGVPVFATFNVFGMQSSDGW